MYKWFILVLLTIMLVIVGTTLAQEIGTINSGNNETMGGGGEWRVESAGVGDGQTMTGVDTEEVLASGLEYLGIDNASLSGEMTPMLGSGVLTGEGISGILLSGIGQEIPDPISKLIVSEVYFDGTDEWIEITNIGDGNFQGNLTLVGAKSTPILLSGILLFSGESKIFGDSLVQISGTSWIGKTGLSLNMIDTAAIDIQIFISGQIADNFVVDQYWVNQYNDQKTSLEKVGNVFTRVQSGRVVNAHSGYVINPGRYRATGENIIDISLPPGQSGENTQQTFSCVSGNQSDLIKINEIFAGNEKYPPYIELSVLQTLFIKSLSISGDMVFGGVEFVFGTGGTTLEKNTVVLLAATGFRQSEGIQSVRNGDFSLVSTGNNLLITNGYRQSGQVLDIVYGSGNTLGKSLYFGGSGHSCGRILDALDDFSPGFERKFLKYFSGTTLVKIECIQTGAITQSGVGACLSTGSLDQNTGDIQLQTGSFMPENYSIRIVNIEYDPEGSDTNNEKITLLATHISGDQTPLDLSKIFRLKVNGTNKTLPRTLPMGVPTTFTKTFGFPNSTDDGQAVVVSLVYDDYVFATYTYNTNQPVPPKELKEVITGDIQNTGVVLDLSGRQFTITYVLPNPKGSDKFEELGLIFTGLVETGKDGNMERWEGESIDLSQGFSLRVGKSSKKLKGIIYGGQENILSGSLGLVNKAACVSLWYQEDELAIFCYPTPKEGQKISASYEEMETTSGQSLDILNALKITRIERDMCVIYGDLPFLCKRFPASKAETKTVNEKNLYKGFASLIKSYLVADWRDLYYDTKLKMYFDMLSGNKSLITKGISTVDIYGQEVAVTNIKQQLEIMETTPPLIVAIFEGIKTLFSEL